MPRRTFARLFKNVTGLGFAQLALRSRLTRAADALRSTDLPAKAIASRFGFRYRSHFHHAFVTHYGMAPGQYRKAALPQEPYWTPS